jgi:NADH dehydrogenase
VDAKRIVVIGGGFAGVYAARCLEKTLRPEEAHITLVNRENYFVFQPLLPEVISGSIGLVDTVSPIRRLCPRTNLYTREIESLDLQRQTVTLAPAVRPRPMELAWDHLVLALGTVTDLSGMPGMAEHAIPFKTLGDALRLRNRVLLALEEADNETDPEFRRHLLTFVVTGGGFSGVEVIAELNDFLRRAARHFRNILPAEIRCVLVHSGEKILPEMSPGLAEYAQRLLARRGVELKLKARVVRATPDSAILNTGETLYTRTVVSTVPSGPVPLVQSLACKKEKGRLCANPFLELEGFEGRVWALGDCASIRMPDGSTAQPTAQHAVREARAAAENIAAAMRGGPQKPFTFEGLGKLGSLGHHSAVAEVFGLRISGLPAWFLWRSVYWMKMPGLERKMRVGLDWLTGLVFGAELVQLRIQASDNITAEHFEPGETIFEQGDLGDRLYVIRKGAVDVLRDGQVVARLTAGEYFGEMALMSSAARTATVQAAEPTDVLAVGKGDFSKLLANFPEFREGLSDLASKRAGSNPQ